jgi:hypothetical protein
MGRRRPARAIAILLLGLVAAVSGSPTASTAAARTPSWTGHWAIVLTCPYPNCANGTGTLDIVQSGSKITGTATAEGGGIALSNGTASGLAATLTFASSQFTIKLTMTMSADGASLTGRWIVTENSTGISRTLGVTGTRASGPSVKASVSAAPSKITVARVAQTPGGKTSQVIVTVTFSNPSTASAANLQLLSLTVVPADRTKAPPKLGFPAASFPVHLGTLAPGAVMTKTFTLDVARGNGVYKVEALALFDDPTAQGGNGRAFGAGGQFQVIRQLAIEGTVVAAPSCASPSCPTKPLPGVTVTAAGPHGGQARTGADGKYSIEVSDGDFTVAATYRNKAFRPTSRSVTVDGSTVSGVDFACAPTMKAGVTTACEVPVLQAGFKKATGTSIELFFQGAGWDPKGGSIHLSISGNPLPDLTAAANFEGVLHINRWPKRITIALAARGNITNGYCWGELAARQGTSFASSPVKGKWAGWVLWSADARIRSGEAWCDGEDNTVFRKSPAPIIAYGFFDQFKPGVAVFNLGRPGAFIGPLASNAPMTFFIPGHNVCVHLSATGKSGAIPSVTTTPGRCT